jgi:hypothetical protein
VAGAVGAAVPAATAATQVAIRTKRRFFKRISHRLLPEGHCTDHGSMGRSDYFVVRLVLTDRLGYLAPGLIISGDMPIL